MLFRSGWRTRVALVLAVIGPGFITANVDNDAGGIAVYSVAGAQFGYSLLWVMIPITVALVIIQEMSSRMGAVTGKGLSDLIREEFGFRATFLLMAALFATNFFNIISEFAGVASSFELFGISKYIVVPVAAFIVWGIVVHGTYNSIEKVFLSASAFYVAYIVSGVLAHPDWRAAALSTVTRPESTGFRNYGYLSTVIALAGTTIAPWMQFYLQASIVEKGVTARQYNASRLDVIIGCLFAAIVAWFIVVACAATLHSVGKYDIETARDAALALRPLAGEYAYLLFAAGLFNASLFAACILPISTAYAVCEGLGLESGLDKRFHEAPAFYWLYTILIVCGAGLLLIPRFPLIRVMFLSQVANGVLLPFVLIFVLLLVNDRELMGKYINSKWYNVVAWTTVGVMIGLTIAMVIAQTRSDDKPKPSAAREDARRVSRVEPPGRFHVAAADILC
jgi:NRAMP (natural resistance-associated macrophage protein)-like metal ion transporter